MGKVYAAEHVHMRKKLAVKVLHRELTTVPEVVARFEREAMAAANIDHANVAAATDFGKLADGAIFLVLEFVQGKNLRDEIAAGPIAVPRALHIARQIAFALSAAHAQGIIHRDLKPENVMLIEKGGDSDFVKVLDFGIAKVPIGEVSTAAKTGQTAQTGQVITKAGMVFGTPEYMAPEQALGQPVDGRADLYALGVILFEMISGNRPFSGDDKVSILGLQLSTPAPKLKDRAPGTDVPVAVERIVEKLLTKDVAQRFQKADDVAAAIEGVIGPPRSVQASSPGLPTPPPHVGKPTFLPNDPLPRFQTNETIARVEGVEALKNLPGPKAPPPPPARPSAGAKPPPPPPHVGKPTFLPNDPLPRFPTSETVARIEGVDALKDLASPDEDPIREPAPSAPAVTQPAIGERAKQLAQVARQKGQLLKQKGAAALGRAAAAVDGSRDRWPSLARRKLSRVSGQTIVLGAIVLLGVLPLLIIVIAVSSGSSSEATVGAGSASATASAAPGPTPTSKDSLALAIDQARAGGVPALEELAKKHPDLATVQLELADALGNAKQYLKATGAVGRALSIDKSAKDDARAARVLFQTAQVTESQGATFALLEGPMEGAGADILYDLVVQEGVKTSARTRADRFIKGSALAKVASPELAVAVAVRKSKTCKEVKELMPRVKEVGDARILVYLDFFERKEKHYDCLTEGGLLEQTRAAVKARLGDAGR